MSDQPDSPDHPRRLPVIGWKEYLDLPELGLGAIKAKVDTGARTSALHVDEVRVLAEHPDGTADLELVITPDRRRPDRRVTARARRLRRVHVTDSGGHRELRPVIETRLRLGPVDKTIRITLTDRSRMLFRMILGRKAIEDDFLVDVAGKYLQSAGRGSLRPTAESAESAESVESVAPTSDPTSPSDPASISEPGASSGPIL